MNKLMGILRSRTFLAAWIATFLYNIAWGYIYPVRNIYFHSEGISLFLIGTFGTAASISMSLAGALIGRFSDRVKRKRFLIVVCLVISAAAYIGYVLTKTYVVILFLITVEMAAVGGYVVMTETIVTRILPEHGRGKSFGRYRIAGSIGFALATISLGVVTASFGLGSIFIFGSIAALIAACLSLLYQERTSKPERENSAAALPRRSAWQIFIKSGLLWLMIADFIATAGIQLSSPFQYIYYKETLLASTGLIGTFATLSVLAEIPTMLLLGPLSDKYGRVPILIIGFIAPTVTLLLIYLSSNLTLLYPASILNGVGIIRYTVGVATITDRVPYEERGSLLGFYYITYGMGGMIAPFIGGILAERFGVRSTFLLAFIVDVIATVLFILKMGGNRNMLASTTSPALIEGD
jgi:MFS family permease